MQFGVRKKDAPEDNFTGDYLRNFKVGETKVRFIEEPDDWITYREHFTPDNKSFPCTEDRKTCPGCTSDNERVAKSSRKYATNVALIGQQNKVLPFRIPVTLADRLAVRAERNGGTLTNRDYVILKSGAGLDTEYDVDQEDKYPVDLPALRAEAKDVQKVLLASYIEVWGDPGDTPARQDLPPENASDDPPFSPPATQSASAGTPDDTVEITELQLREMTRAELAELSRKAGLDYGDYDTRSEMVDRLLAAFG